MKSLSPAEVQSLLTTDVDIVDVREPDEWATGHVPGARLVPLSLLRADPLGALPRDNVVFVCAKGGRSAQACDVASGVGRTTVYSMNGGTDAWRAAGLPIVMPGKLPVAAKTTTTTTTTSTAAATSAGDGAPEAGLDAVVGDNLKRERAARGWALDDLAREAGISRTLLGQIELGRATPSIAIVWKIAAALGVPFATLLAQPAPRIGTTLSRRDQAKKLTSADGRMTSRALYPPGDAGAAEFYELRLAPHSREDAEAHRPGTRENLVVASGRLELKIGAETLTLGPGDAVNFAADQPHGYTNPGSDECWLYLVMNYATR
jgi:rhodanese-related sulfurtransferase/transcriptional regulator with XRE-family HTH domain